MSLDASVESKFSEALSLARALLNAPLLKPESIELPESGGVYLFRNSAGNIIYVGKAKNLRRRIHIDHLSQELQDTMSAFRRSINRVFSVPFGPEIRSWICQNCSVSYYQIDNSDMRSIVEALLISVGRSDFLLNSS